jgi:hypothetical protein
MTCLLSGLDIFTNTGREDLKYRQTVKGLHGLHVYATEYWTEHLLYLARSPGGLDKFPSAFNLASRLADKLSDGCSDGEVADGYPGSSLFKNRLQALRSYPTLYKCVERALIARSLKSLESELLQINSAYHEPICIVPNVT